MEQLLLKEEGGSLIPVTLSTPQEQEKWEKLLSSGCVVKLKISLPSNTIKVGGEKIKERGESESAPVLVDSTKSLVKVSTSKYVSSTYESLLSLSSEVRRHVKDMGYPYYGHDGEYILPVKKLGEALAYLREKKAEWDGKVALFLAEWEDIKSISLEQLKALGDSRNYPPVEAIQEKFSWFYTVKSISSDFSIPENLEDIDEESYLETVEVMKENLQSTLSLLSDSITSGMVEILEDLSNSLTNGKKLHKKSFEKGMEICNFLLNEGGNMLGNETLSRVCEDFKKLISGDSAGLVKACKDSQGTKEAVKTALSNFHTTLKNSIRERALDL